MGSSHSQHSAADGPSVLVSEKTCDGVTYTVVDGPSTTAVHGSSAARNSARMRMMRHPNILAFARLSDTNTAAARKGSIMGLPQCRHLPTVLRSSGSAEAMAEAIRAADTCDLPVTPSEVLYGLTGILEALRVCASVNIFFTHLYTSQIGVAMATGRCHPVNAHRWVLLDFSTANGTHESDSALAFASLCSEVLGALDKGLVESAVAKRWGMGMGIGEGEGEGDDSRPRRQYVPLSPTTVWRGVADGNPFAALLHGVGGEAQRDTEAPSLDGDSHPAAHGHVALMNDADEDTPSVPGVVAPPPLAAASELPSTHGEGSGSTELTCTHSSVKKELLTPPPPLTEGEKKAKHCVSYFERVSDFIANLDDPLVTAMSVGQNLPTYYAADSCVGMASSSGVGDALNEAYERLQRCISLLSVPLEVRRCVVDAGASAAENGKKAAVVLPLVELRRCVYPWLLSPENLAQPTSSHLFASIFSVSQEQGASGEGAQGVEHHNNNANNNNTNKPSFCYPLITECMKSCDPHLGTRFFAHAASLAQHISSADLFLLVEGIVYTCFHTSSGLGARWVRGEQLRYCRSSVKAADVFIRELASRSRNGSDNKAKANSNSTKGAKPAQDDGRAFVAAYHSLSEELCGLLFACVECAESAGTEHAGEAYRLMRDVLVAIAALVAVSVAVSEAAPPAPAPSSPLASSPAPVPPSLSIAEAKCKHALALSLFQWSAATREQAVNVVVSCIGTTMPLHVCDFLLACMVTLSGVEDSAIRNAACTGLLRLSDGIGAMRDDSAVIRSVSAAGSKGSDGIYELFPLCPFRPEGSTIQHFTALEPKRLASQGYSDGSALIAALGKERLKIGGVGTTPPEGLFNAVFRNGCDKATSEAVLYHSAF